MGTDEQAQSFNDKLAWGLMIFSGYGLFITFFLNLLTLVILPFSHQTMQDVFTPKGGEPLPIIEQMAMQIKIGFIAFFIYLVLLLTSSFKLKQEKGWARLATLLLLVIPTLLILVGLGFLFTQWPLFSTIPLPFWLTILLLTGVLLLEVFLVSLILKLGFLKQE